MRLLSSLHKAMGGWPRGAVALWVQDKRLALFAQEQLHAGAVKLMYPIKGKTGVSASDIRHDLKWDAVGPPQLGVTSSFVAAATQAHQDVVPWFLFVFARHGVRMYAGVRVPCPGSKPTRVIRDFWSVWLCVSPPPRLGLWTRGRTPAG